MRLTLRTLLAYLDDTLDPTQTKLIGQKVAESDIAQQLIARIRELSRQHRQAIPPATGPEARLDVNTLAEYLDNVLPPEQVGQVEEICLESDLYLGEVCNCHQILTFLEGEPMQVSPPARQRMYGLIKGGGGASPRKVQPAKNKITTGPADDREDADETLLLGLPNFLRRGAWGRWLAPLTCILLLMAALAVTVWLALPHDSPSGKPTEVAHHDDKAGDKDPEKTPQTSPEKQPETAPEKTPEKVIEKTPEKQPETPPEKVPEKQPEKQPIGTVPADRPNAERRALGKFVIPARGFPQMLLQRPKDKSAWQRVAPGSKVFSSDPLVCLPGFRGEVQLDAGLGMRLWGGLPEFGSDQGFREGRELPVLESMVVLHVPEAPFTVDLTLDHGRVLLLSKNNGETKIKVRFQREIWQLTLLDDQTQVALDLWGRYPRNVPFSKEPGGEEPMAVLILSVLKGSASLKVGFETFRMRPATQYVWDNVGPAERAPQNLPKLPEWYSPLLPARTPQIQEAVAALEELNIRLVQKDASMDGVLSQLRRDPKSSNRILGVLCLGAIDDVFHLMDTLNDPRPEMRNVAIETLRHWIGRRGDHDLKLYKLLHEQKDYSRPQAEIVMLLLHSFSEEDTAKPETYETLIDYLRHAKLPIRELAYWHLFRLAPEGAKKIPYDPAGKAEQRENACKMWEQYIPSGKLPPKPGTPVN